MRTPKSTHGGWHPDSCRALSNVARNAAITEMETYDDVHEVLGWSCYSFFSMYSAERRTAVLLLSVKNDGQGSE